MRTWQMIKELTENPTKRFTYDTATEGSYVTVKDVAVVWQGKEQEGQMLGVNIANEGWEEVKQPVNFMEAVESGKRIKVEHADESINPYHDLDCFLDELLDFFTEGELRDILINGTFYIED